MKFLNKYGLILILLLLLVSISSVCAEEYKRPTRFCGGKEILTHHETDVIDGWNPADHEINRYDIGNGMERIEYDDGYFRIVDSHGYVVTWGF